MKKIFILLCATILLTKTQGQDNSWTQKANANGIDRAYAVGFSIGAKGYIGTGLGAVNGFMKDFWEYDTATNAWTQRADFGGGGRRMAVGFSIGSKGYIGTGQDETNAKHNDFWEYNPAANIWTRKADFGDLSIGGTYLATGFSIGNKGFIGTGLQEFGGSGTDFWEYDPGTNTWTKKADFAGGGRTEATGFSIGSKGYIGTGRDQLTGYKSDFWEYDPATNTWTEKASLVRAREGAVGFSIYGNGYIGTGYNGVDNNDFWEYDPATNAWTQKALVGGSARSYAVGFSIGSKGYIGNGVGGGSAYDDFWEYTPDKTISTTIGAPSLVAGSSVSVSFTATGTYNAGNTFTAQLSNASGSFTIPVNIGSVGATTSATINATIPSNSQGGTGYRIRVISNNPAFIGSDNGADIRVLVDAWTQKTDFGGIARIGAVSFSIGGKGYIGTGTVDPGGVLTNDFWEYDTATNAWTQKANFGELNSGRTGAAGFSIGNKGYIGTGFNFQQGGAIGTVRDFWEYDPAANTWTRKADFGGTVRRGATGFSIGSKGYIGTGVNLNDFWEYDPAANVWTRKADFGGTGRSDAVGFSIGTKGYIGTGSDGTYKNDLWEYNPTANTWARKADFGGTGRAGAAGFGISGKGYIGTGFDGLSLRNDFWEYDTANNAWTQKTNFSGTPRSYASGFSIGSKGYIGAGDDGPDGANFRNDFWKYTPEIIVTTVAGTSLFAGSSVTVFFTATGTFNAGNTFTAQSSNSSGSFAIPVIIGSIAATTSGAINATIPLNTKGGSGYRIRVVSSSPALIGNDNGNNITVIAAPDQWTQKTDFGGTERYYAVGFSIGGKGYIGTGYDGGTKNDFWVYDTATNAWTQKANFGGPGRQGAVGFSIGSKGYIGTGLDASSNFLNDFWEYDPGTNQWTQKANLGGGARSDATGFSIGNKGYIGTGNAATGTKNDFWEYDPVTNQWTQKANFGGGFRSGATGFSIGRKGYIGTGTGGGIDFWEYDQATNIWTRKADFGGVSRQGATGFNIGSQGYIGTGLNGSTNFKKDFWRYDPATNTWTQRTDFSGTGRLGATGFSIGSKGYLGTGNDLGITKDFWQYSPEPSLQSDIIIATNLSGTSFCVGALVSVPFITTGTFNTGNIFTAQLSAANGDFTNAVNIGTLNGTTSGSINAIIPANTAAGTAYRIRVTSSNPAITGDDNGANIAIGTPITAGITNNTGTTILTCTTTSISLTATGGTTYSWSNGSTVVSTTANLIVTAAGTYTVTVTSAGGCTDTKSISITQNTTPPTAGITNNTGTTILTCTTTSISLTATGGSIYSWSNGSIVVSTTANLTITAAGTYTVTVTSGSGCTDTKSISITQNTTPPPAGITNNTGTTILTCTTTSISLTATGGSMYSWSNGSTIVSTTANLTVTAPGTYTLTATSTNGCIDTKSISITQNCPGAWTQKASFGGTTRRGAVGFSIGSKGYIGTGYDGSLKKDFWEYDTITRAWTQKADFGGSARAYAVGFNLGSKGYIGTGNAIDGVKKDFWEYDPANNSWAQKADFTGIGRSGATGFSIGSKGYIGTGNDIIHNTNLGDFREYDPSTNTWTQRADFGGGTRTWATGFRIGSRGYMGTGQDNNLNPLKDFWEYNPDTNTWTQKADFGGTERINAVGFSIGSLGYIGTGFGDGTDFWEYYPATNVWTRKADFGGAPRSEATGFSIGSKGYIGIGFDGVNTIYNDFWEYNPFGTPLANTIATNLSGTSFCAGASISVPFIITGTFNTGNIFTAQLSAANGDFTNDVNIGTLNSTTDGSINAIIPANTAAGTGYRVRVTSSNPAITGEDNGANITIVTPITAGITNNTGTTTLTCTTTSISLTATGGSTYSWSNGSIVVSTIANLTVTAPGTYTITVTSAGGCTDTKSISITQNTTPPTAGITNNTGTTTLTCAPTSISLTGTGGGTYSWSNGSIVVSTTANLTVTAPGTYTVTVTSAGGCTDTKSISIAQNTTPPTAGITNNTGTTTLTCTTTSISLTATGGGTYSWSNGSIVVSTTANLTVTAPGTYTVTVTSANGCTDTKSISIAQDATPPTATISYTGSPYCNSGISTVTQTGTTGGTYTSTSGLSIDASTGAINLTQSTPGSYTVTYSFSSGSCSNTTTANVVINSVPAAPASIAGATSLCSGTTNVAYTASTVNGVTSYTWIVPAGWTITDGQGTASIHVTAGTSGGNITVTANNNCGSSNATLLAVSISSAPATPGTISGPSSSCAGVNNLTYSIAAVSGATSYSWTVPSGWSINGSASGTSISVSLSTSAQSGNVSVAAVNACGSSSARTLAVTVNPLPPTPGPISGNSTVCASSVQTYSIAAVSGATSYTWTVPAGWSFKKNSPTSISVSAKVGTTGGNISVTANNACGSSAQRTLALTVITTPTTPGAIAGSTSPCAGSWVTYSIGKLASASFYTWAVPKGWSINSGQGTTAIQVTAGKAGQKGNISVKASNACGTSSASTLAVTTIACTSIASGSVSTINAEKATPVRTVKISPNPAINTLHVELLGYTGKVTIQLLNIQGKALMQEKMETTHSSYAQHQLDVGNIAGGTYLLVVIDEKGNRQTEKVIISR